ncbi:MAG: HAD-IB family hydrolase [Candidatus Nanopelagicales bacterium]
MSGRTRRLFSAYRRAGEAAAEAANPRPEPHAGADPTVAAFFDIDNTLIRGSSMFHLARIAAQRKLLTVRDIAGFAVAQLRFTMIGGEDLDDMAEAVEAGLSFVAGKPTSEIRALAEDVFDELMTDKLWPGTLDLARRHLDAGEPVWLVSASPVELASVIAERLGFTGALGTVSEIVDGHYTGVLVGHPLHGVAKAEAVRSLAARDGLDLARCWAYSDSANDLPMLTTVGNPVAVNPDSDLRGQARDNGWPVYDFRRKRVMTRVGIPAAATLAAATAVGVGAGVAVARRHSR